MSCTGIVSFFVGCLLKFSRLRQRPGTAERNFPRNSSAVPPRLLRNEKNSWLFLLLSLISFFWEAFFFYIPVIDDDRKCLVFVLQKQEIQQFLILESFMMLLSFGLWRLEIFRRNSYMVFYGA